MAALALLAAAVLAFQAAPTALAQDGAAGWKRLGREAAVLCEKDHCDRAEAAFFAGDGITVLLDSRCSFLGRTRDDTGG